MRNSPILYLSTCLSDHVHYYQGGAPFEYVIVNPRTLAIRYEILGPDLAAGHKLQVIVEGNMWKAGRLLTKGQKAKNGYVSSSNCDYCLVAEAVGPGFDVLDFGFVHSESVHKEAPRFADELVRYCHDVPEDWNSYYQDAELLGERKTSRLGLAE